MSFLSTHLRLLSAAAFFTSCLTQAQSVDTVTVISNGVAIATTSNAGGVAPANAGIAIPFVAATGGPIMESVFTAEPTPAAAPPPGSVTTPPPTTPPPTTVNSNPNCQQCSIYFQYINAYYWPTDNTNNTACLSGVTERPSTALPSGLTPISPSVYLVFPTISAGNECTQVGNVYISQTLSFAPGALSTMVGTSGVVQPFNFGDLPCPPPEVAAADSWFYNPSWNPGRAYSPMVSPPPEIFALDPAFADCVAAVYQGFDPPYPMPTYKGNFGGGGGWRRKRSAPAHLVARVPQETAAAGPVQTQRPLA